jgi:hypothetical protein
MRLKRAGLSIALFVLLTGCNRVTTVQDVQANPHRNWLTSTVRLQGTVGSQAPLIDARLYQLQDATGTIWVLSRKPPLQPGQQVLIQGQVRYQPIEIAGQDLGDVYIEEEQQLQPEP